MGDVGATATAEQLAGKGCKGKPAVVFSYGFEFDFKGFDLKKIIKIGDKHYETNKNRY